LFSDRQLSIAASKTKHFFTSKALQILKNDCARKTLLKPHLNIAFWKQEHFFLSIDGLCIITKWLYGLTHFVNIKNHPNLHACQFVVMLRVNLL